MNASAKEPHLAALRAELNRRGWSGRDLARATGFTSGSVANLICGSSSSSRAWRRIEAALEKPFITDPREFSERLPMIRFFGGVDIEALPNRELQDLWTKMSGRRRRPKLPGGNGRAAAAHLIELLASHFAAAHSARSAAEKPTAKIAALAA